MIYNNDWLIKEYQAGKNIKFVFFWGHQEAKNGNITKSCLSQWWYAPFDVEGKTYLTAEHWMMAEKARLFYDTATEEKILRASSPAEAKKLGRMVSGFIPAVWDAAKFNIVMNGNFQKFKQHKALKDFLLGTNDCVLVEASPVDAIWGIGIPADHPTADNPLQWRGENLLGYILMEVRGQLKK